MIAAVTLGESGRCYIVGGRFHTLAEVGPTVAQVSGVRVPQRTIPYPLALVAGWLSEAVARLRT